MKTIIKSGFLKVYFTLMAMAATMFTFAQEKKLDVDIDVNKGGDWYMQPWVWVVGGAIFILLLVALLRSGKSKG